MAVVSSCRKIKILRPLKVILEKNPTHNGEPPFLYPFLVGKDKSEICSHRFANKKGK